MSSSSALCAAGSLAPSCWISARIVANSTGGVAAVAGVLAGFVVAGGNGTDAAMGGVEWTFDSAVWCGPIAHPAELPPRARQSQHAREVRQQSMRGRRRRRWVLTVKESALEKRR